MRSARRYSAPAAACGRSGRFASAAWCNISDRVRPRREHAGSAHRSVFSDAAVPGLTEQPDYLLTSAFAELDYRQPINARRGGWYRLEFSRYDDRDFNAYSFNRVEVDLRQYVPFLAERRVFAGRALVSTSDVDAGQTVPFYLMPYLGGSDTLRGFREYRFRGPHALLLQAEYRYESGPGSTARSSTMPARSRSSGRISIEGPREGLRLRFPLQHGQRSRHACRRGIRKQRWQTSVHHVRWLFLGGARTGFSLPRSSSWARPQVS